MNPSSRGPWDETLVCVCTWAALYTCGICCSAGPYGALQCNASYTLHFVCYVTNVPLWECLSTYVDDKALYVWWLCLALPRTRPQLNCLFMSCSYFFIPNSLKKTGVQVPLRWNMLHLDWNQRVLFFFPSTAILVLYILSARPLLSDLSAAATQGNYLITQWVSHHSYLSSGHCDELCGECIVWVYMSVCVSLQSVLNYACVNRHSTFPSISWKFHIQYECLLPFNLQHEANYCIISACICSNVCSLLSLLVSLEEIRPNMTWAGKIWNIINTWGQRKFF